MRVATKLRKIIQKGLLISPYFFKKKVKYNLEDIGHRAIISLSKGIREKENNCTTEHGVIIIQKIKGKKAPFKEDGEYYYFSLGLNIDWKAPYDESVFESLDLSMKTGKPISGFTSIIKKPRPDELLLEASSIGNGWCVTVSSGDPLLSKKISDDIHKLLTF